MTDEKRDLKAMAALRRSGGLLYKSTIYGWVYETSEAMQNVEGDPADAILAAIGEAMEPDIHEFQMDTEGDCRKCGEGMMHPAHGWEHTGGL